MSCGQKQAGGRCLQLKVGAVLLAAGEGSRLGRIPKCLMRLQDEPLISRHLTALRHCGIDEVIVVTGYYYADIETVARDFPVTVMRNPHPEVGQQSSVRLGLEALGEGFDLVMVVLADQPLLGGEALSELIAAYKHRATGTCIVYPEVKGQRGNPVLFSGQLITELLASHQTLNVRQFIDHNPALVHVHLTDNDQFILDIDTPDDVAAFEQKTGLALTMPTPMAREP